MPAMPTMQCNHHPSFSNSRLGIMHATSPNEDASEMEGGHATSNRARGSICIPSGQGKEKRSMWGAGVGVGSAWLLPIALMHSTQGVAADSDKPKRDIRDPILMS